MCAQRSNNSFQDTPTPSTLVDTSADTSVDVSHDPDWWRGAVIYQIYPRSFQDSNNDGIGDLAGITERLPHVASLGADAIWISPFFQSPMKDFGYDVSDYRAVDPIFGTLADFDMLVSRSKELGIKVIIDLVLSHTSDQHPWFKESKESRNNPRHDWYVWADSKPDGSPPNNWLSIFGGPGWSWNSTRCQYYQHNFLNSQPDLNFHNPDVQDALLEVVRFWLDRGVDGFRLDTINFYFSDKELRDNPALPVADRNASIAPEVNPYNYQNHLYDKNQPENIEFLKRFRALLDEYPAITAVGEIGDAQCGMQLLNDYTRGKDRVHMCYTFEFLSAEIPTAERVAQVLRKFETEAADSWTCWAFSNHDVVRHASRWAADNAHQKEFLELLAALLMSLRGSVCIYQGEELGLPEAQLTFEQLQDPYGISFWPKFKGRDGCRTPMVWSEDLPNGGFSTSQPWLPVVDAQQKLAVSTQLDKEHSLLEHYRRMLNFRKNHQPLVKGSIEEIHTAGNVLRYTRQFGNETIYCAFNFNADPIEHAINSDRAAHLLKGHGFNTQLVEQTLHMPGFAAAYVRLD
ncbi:MAG: alpha-glucosidase family protein [Granulosicoccus sp.]|nr:alpha-glucosidase family protein [Granulosicoccus sp.]